MYKIRITDLNELKQRLRLKWARLYHVIRAAAFVSDGVVDSSRSVMRVCSPLALFPTRCYQLDSNLVNLKNTTELE